MPYRLGANGRDGEIDCIHLTYAVLRELKIDTPPFRDDWYTASKWSIARDLHRWGRRIQRPIIDGDVLLLAEERAFAAAWQSGILFITRTSNRVAWSPVS